MENRVDLSFFFLVEGSADSETHDHSSFKEDDYNFNNHICHRLDDDDARSCSYESTNCIYQGFGVEEDNDELSSMESFVMNNTNSSEESEVEVEGEVMMSREAMDAMEDKVFWEACIAVGYPA